MSEDVKGLFTQSERQDLARLVSATDTLLGNAQFRRDLGDIACATYTNPLSRAATDMLSSSLSHVSDEEFQAFNETTEALSHTVWGNRPHVNIDRGKLIEDVLSAALSVQTAVNRCMRADTLAKASDEWEILFAELKEQSAQEEAIVNHIDADGSVDTFDVTLDTIGDVYDESSIIETKGASDER